ncbi:MAG: sigma-70 family RNA polymerase sigma factor [Myxococcales bacterium]|nr:sigma-70 family RNA polymerase sigma factor [Myxococcales bacterium]
MTDFEQLFREHGAYVLRLSRRLGVRPADAEDVAQEVFLVVHQALSRFEGRSSHRTWISGICVRVVSNYRRKAHRRHEQAGEPPVEPAELRDPERAAIGSSGLAQLDAALSKLSEPQRASFVLFEIEQLSVVEISEALGCSKFTTYARLQAARRAVQKAFEADAVLEVADV